MATVGGKKLGKYGAEITVEGLEGLVKALRALDPTIMRIFRKEIRTAVSEVASIADAFAPGPAKGGYKVRSGAGGKSSRSGIRAASFGMRIEAVSKNAAIFEFAGKPGTNVKTTQGRAMIRWLDGFGQPGRFLWEAWDMRALDVKSRIEAAIREAEAALQRAVDAGTARGLVD